MSDHDMIDIGDHRIDYRRVGQGPDLVFVHGWPFHGETWRHVVERLSPTFTCHVFDLPGAGATETTEGAAIDFDDHAAHVERLVDELGLERYTLIGQDSGGLIGRRVAADRPDQVEALVLTGTEIPGHLSLPLRLLLVTARIPDGGLGLRTALRSRLLRRSPVLLGGCFHDVDLADGEFHRLFIEPMITDDRVFAGSLARLKTFKADYIHDLAEVHPRITAPTLFIWGEDDPFFPVDDARTMADQFGGPTRFEVIPDAKLLVYEERPDRFAELCREFLTEVLPEERFTTGA